MSQAPPPLEVRGVVKAYGDTVAVDGVDLTLGAEERLALVGPSGCGKSTLLRAVAGLVNVDAGTIRLAGRLVDDGAAHLPPERRGVGLVFQEHALFPHLTVRANVGFGLRKNRRQDVATNVDRMLALVDLDRHADRYPHELSGGERQRVALARALAPEPALMLFDEPFASLDHNLRVQLRHDVASALRATGTPAVIVTHDQREALAVGDRIAVMRGGRIVQVDTPAGIFHTPADRFVASFMGEASFLPIEDNEGVGARTALGPVGLDGADASDSTSAVTAMVRPDDVRFSTDGTEQEADGAAAEVTAAEYHGTGWLAAARLDDGTEVQFLASHLEPPTIGQRGRLQLVEGHRQVVVPDHRWRVAE